MTCFTNALEAREEPEPNYEALEYIAEPAAPIDAERADVRGVLEDRYGRMKAHLKVVASVVGWDHVNKSLVNFERFHGRLDMATLLSQHRQALSQLFRNAPAASPPESPISVSIVDENGAVQRVVEACRTDTTLHFMIRLWAIVRGLRRLDRLFPFHGVTSQGDSRLSGYCPSPDEPFHSGGFNAWRPHTLAAPAEIKVFLSGKMSNMQWTRERARKQRFMTRLQAVKQLFHAFVNRTQAYEFATQVGLTLFGSAVAQRCPVTPVLSRFRTSLDAVEPTGDTCMYDAIIAACNELEAWRLRYETLAAQATTQKASKPPAEAEVASSSPADAVDGTRAPNAGAAAPQPADAASPASLSIPALLPATPPTDAGPFGAATSARAPRLRIICLTDGADTASTAELGDVEAALRTHNIILDCIVIGDEASSELCMAAHKTGGYVFEPKELHDALQIMELENMLESWQRPPQPRFGSARRPLFGVAFTPATAAALPVSDAPDQRAEIKHRSQARGDDVPLSTLNPKQCQRIAAELRRFSHPAMDVYLVHDRIDLWKVIVEGPPGTPYAGGTWAVLVHFGANYPQRPPEVRFQTPIRHCNINHAGRVCHSVLARNWSAQTTMQTVFECVYGLLLSPDTNDPLDSHLALLFYQGTGLYETSIAEHTARHAVGTTRQAWKKQLGEQEEPPQEAITFAPTAPVLPVPAPLGEFKFGEDDPILTLASTTTPDGPFFFTFDAPAAPDAAGQAGVDNGPAASIDIPGLPPLPKPFTFGDP